MKPRCADEKAVGNPELQALSAMADALAQRLGEAAGQASCGGPALRRQRARSSEPDAPQVAARRYLKARRRRDPILLSGLCSDPCWDILLDLFASQAEGKPVSVSSACIASGVPATTALRWLSRMDESGLVTRRSDPRDSRRIYVSLSERATRMVARWIADTFSCTDSGLRLIPAPEAATQSRTAQKERTRVRCARPENGPSNVAESAAKMNRG